MKKKLALFLATILCISPLTAKYSNASSLGSGVTSPYYGQDFGAQQGQITLNSYQTPGSTVYFSDTNGYGIQNGTILDWIANNQDERVQFIEGQATFPDGSQGSILQYDLQSTNYDNGYLLVAQQDLSDWVSAMQGNPDYVNSQLQANNGLSTMQRGPGLDWTVAPLPDVINYSGGIIQFLGGSSSRTYVVTSDGMHAVPAVQVKPTPPPVATLSVQNPKQTYSVGDTINLNLGSQISAANTNYHRVALEAQWYENGQPQSKFLPVQGQNGTTYQPATGIYFDQATSIPGGSSNGTAQTYTDTGIFDTTGIPAGNVQLAYILYDNVDRQAQTQYLTLNLQSPTGPQISLAANPTSLQVGQASQLTATTQNMPSTDNVVILDQDSKSTLSGSNQIQGTSASATDQTAETVHYIAEILDGSGNIVMTSNQVQVTWGSSGVVNTPTISLSANPTQLTIGQSSSLTATAQNVPQGDTVAINDIKLLNTLSGGNQVKGTTATATSNSAIIGTYQAVILDSSGNIAYSSNQVQVTWQKPPNTPPVAKIYVQSPVKVGDDETLDGGNSYDPDQPNATDNGIGSWHWTVTGPGKFSGSTTGKTSTGQFDTPGTYTINLTVYDTDGGDSGTTSTTIQILPPGPTAVDNIGGTLKQNRLVTLDTSGSTSPKDYPIDWTKTHWTITAISGGTATDIKYSGSLDPNQTNNVLFKQPGQYQVSVTVTNSLGLSDTNTQTITIAPDYKPIADYSWQSQKILRDPNDNDWGTYKFYDKSNSPDGDTIAKHIWYFVWDKYNQFPNFPSSQNPALENDPVLTIDDSTLTFGQPQQITFDGNPYIVEKAIENGQYVLYVKTKNVGHIDMELQVQEDFGQPTIPQFISPSDYKTGDTWTESPPAY